MSDTESSEDEFFDAVSELRASSNKPNNDDNIDSNNNSTIIIENTVNDNDNNNDNNNDVDKNVDDVKPLPDLPKEINKDDDNVQNNKETNNSGVVLKKEEKDVTKNAKVKSDLVDKVNSDNNDNNKDDNIQKNKEDKSSNNDDDQLKNSNVNNDNNMMNKKINNDSALQNKPIPPPRRKVKNDITKKNLKDDEEPSENDIRMMIKNLDTGESCRIDKAVDFFPELKQVMTLEAFDKQHQTQQNAIDINNVEQKIEPEHETFLNKLKNFIIPGSSSLRKPGADNHINVKVKKKTVQDLSDLIHINSILRHTGPIWVMEWSLNGEFLATGGQDSIVRVWVTKGSSHGVDPKYTEERDKEDESRNKMFSHFVKKIPSNKGGREIVLPYRMFSGHKADVIDLAWSKGNFLLSASIDKTVRLWHISRKKCLCLFQHADFVTAVMFHPVEDKYFLSGSFDRKIRIWNIPDHCVVEWAQTANIITAASFSPDGKRVVAGLYNGQCVFYNTHGLKYVTQVDARNRHGKYRKGKKVTGLQFTPDGKHLLVTTNDSRLRLYSMDDYSCVTKYKGLSNNELQIHAYLNASATKIICGSENGHAYVWNVKEKGHENDEDRYTSESYESFRAHSTTVTCAQFVPPNAISLSAPSALDSAAIRQLICTAGYNGQIKFFENRGVRKLL